MRIKKFLSSLHEGHMWLALCGLIGAGMLTGAVVGLLSVIHR